MLGALQHRIADAARRSAFAGVGAVFGLVGLGFLTVAGWLVLEATRDATFAAIVLGLVYLGISIVALAIAFSRPTPPPPPPPVAQTNPIASLIPAFLAGFEQGRDMRRPR
ncbi:phage holin family protein [Albirhodobacter sp. R86504]|uniref:phage holin family protein n=1 Tax=Albirhodobacter sp. R86504 TaxID=3093848 RepID=UPI00366E8EB6